MADVLTGSTEFVSLGSVLQLAESEVLTGTLKVGLAELGLYGGRVVRASYGRADGVDALMEAMLQRGAPFTLDNAPVAAGPSLGETGPLLLEAFRLMDDWARIEALVLRALGPLEPALATLAPALDGTRTVGAAADQAGVVRVRIIDPLLAAYEAGAFEQLATPLPPPLPADFDSLIDRGRAYLRDGRYADARDAFERAVALRPDDRVATQNLRRIVALSRNAS